MKEIIKPALLFLLLLVLSFTGYSSEFELIKKENGIALYERWIHYNGNTVRELKVQFMARAGTAKKVLFLLKDQQKGSQWNTNASSFKIAHTPDEAVWFTYVRYKLPWPMNDQDCSLKYYLNKTELHQKLCTIYFESGGKARFPEINNVTRITGTRGKWTIEKNSVGTAKITYQIVSDKSANVPRWVSDPVIHGNIFKSIGAFKLLLEKA